MNWTNVILIASFAFRFRDCKDEFVLQEKLLVFMNYE